MKRTSRISLLLLAAAIVGFLVVAWSIADNRLRSGDIFPAYSTLRADPMGYGVLHAVLEADARVAVGRHLRPEDMLRAGPGDVVVLAGVDTQSLFGRVDGEALDRLAASGAHIVLLASPEFEYKRPADGRRERGQQARRERLEAERVERERRRAAERERMRRAREGGDAGDGDAGKRQDPGTSGQGAEKEAESGKPEEGSEGELDPLRNWRALILPWEVDFSVADLPQDKEAPPRIRDASRADGAPRELPQTLRVSGALRVIPRKEGKWEPLYLLDGEPVALTSVHGKGRITLLSDSYVLSNEAMASLQPAEWVVHLFGGARRVIFSEHHLGVVENRTLADLARSYGLGPAMLSAVFVLLLMFWRQSSRLLPPREQEGVIAAPQVSGAAALSPLLARAMQPGDIVVRLLDTATAAGGGARIEPAKLEKLRRILADAAWEKPKPTPLELYRRLARALRARR